MSKAIAYSWKDLAGASSGGVTRKEIAGKGASLKQVIIPAGTVADRHEHPFEQFIQVLSGSGRLECDAGSVDLQPGTVVHLPPGAWHSAVFETDMTLVEVNLAEGD